MVDSLFSHVLVPLANEEDAQTTAAAISPHIAAVEGTITAVNVIEKADGAPDKASVEQREEYATKLFNHFRSELRGSDINVESEILYGTDIPDTIIDAAHNQGASAIVFTPRGGGRWIKLLTGDVTTALVNKSDLPVVVLPDPTQNS